MNLAREDKIEVIVTFAELIQALRLLHPNEFILRQFAQPDGGTTRPTLKGEVVGSGVKLTMTRSVPAAALEMRRLPVAGNTGD